METRLTPLHGLHSALGAKLVPFAGWEMPVNYPTGLIAEHEAARSGAALFDVSHMAEVELSGDGAALALEALVPASVTTLKPGHARYTQFTTETGGIIDDLIVTNLGDRLHMVLNASRREADLAHLRAALPASVTLTELTDRALIAVQGPGAAALLAPMLPDLETLFFMQSAEMALGGTAARVSRLGYTGEDGVEISLPAATAESVAKDLIDRGAIPAGLGARDSLRLEAGLCLYGQDIDETTSPTEASLAWSIPKRRREGGGFPGADRILKEIAEGPARRLVGLRPEGRAPARAGTEIQNADGEKIGHVTSGGFSPTLGVPVSMGYVASEKAAVGTEVALIVRGKARPATVSALPFVPARQRRKTG